MNLREGPFERPKFLVQYLTPRPRKRRQLTRYAVALFLLIGLFLEVSYEALMLAVLVGIYVELMMRKPEELGRRTW